MLGLVSSWLLVLTGLILGFEVCARYFFNSPTIWASETSQLLLLWGTYLGMVCVHNQGRHIRIDILITRLSPRMRLAAEMFNLVFIATLSLVIAWLGWDIALNSIERGRSSGTMLDLPVWWIQVVIPLAFGVLFLQCVAELCHRAAPGRRST